MPVISTSEGSPGRRWKLELPTEFGGRQPEWLTTGFGLSYIALTHTGQIKFGISSSHAALALYAACVVVGVITGKLVRNLTDRLTRSGAGADRVPRIFAAGIVLAGMAVGALPGTSVVPAGSGGWAVQWLWLATGGLLVTVTVIGELLVCWFPAADTAPGPQAAGPAAGPAPASRPRRWRLRPDTVQ